MASLRRAGESPFWIACLTLPDGTRTNRSTKCTDRRQAQRMADEWQDASDRARRGVFAQQQARAVLHDILVRVGEEGLTTDTAEAFLRQWVEGKQNPRTRERYERTVEVFLASLKERSNALLATISYRDIQGFIDHRTEEGVASRTVVVDVKTLSAAFNMARRLGIIHTNPVEKTLALKPVVVHASQRSCFTPEEVKALLDAASGDWVTMVLLGYFTGARLGDCAAMTWPQVDLDAGVIRYVPQKTRRTGRGLVIPMHPDLLNHLRRLAGDSVGYLCPSLATRPVGGHRGLSNRFKRLMIAAGIDPQTSPGDGVRRFSRLTFHSLRHSFNSLLANRGVPQDVRMELVGHSSADVNAAYTHHDMAHLRGAIDLLPGLSGVVEKGNIVELCSDVLPVSGALP